MMCTTKQLEASAFCPHNIHVCVCGMILRINSDYSHKANGGSVSCEAGTEYLNIIVNKFVLQRVSRNAGTINQELDIPTFTHYINISAPLTAFTVSLC
jgi:hypothetical protein